MRRSRNAVSPPAGTPPQAILRRFLGDRSASIAIEYGLIAVLVAVAAVPSVALVAQALADLPLEAIVEGLSGSAAGEP